VRRKTPPPGFIARVVVTGDEEVVLLEWDASAPEPPKTPLSPAEGEVLALVRKGRSNAQIAAARKVSLRTVANQVAQILRKTGASSRYGLMAVAIPREEKD